MPVQHHDSASHLTAEVMPGEAAGLGQTQFRSGGIEQDACQLEAVRVHSLLRLPKMVVTDPALDLPLEQLSLALVLKGLLLVLP